MYKINAIIVTFNPDNKNINMLVECLSHQVERVCIVDNASNNNDFLNAKNAGYVDFIKLSDNLGIAKAQNLGIDQCICNGAEYLVFFDQDSRITPDFVLGLHQAFSSLSTKDSVAAVGPIFFNQKYNFAYPQIKLKKWGGRKKIIPIKNESPIEVSFIISSGTFTTVDVLNRVGLMKDEFFIDYVDTEWCLRAISFGYKFFVIPKVQMIHTIGDDKIKFLLWNLPVHSPWRRYFRMRNMFYLFTFKYVPVSLKFREFIINNLHQCILIICKKDKKKYLSYWLKSFIDGIKILINKWFF